MLSMGYGNLWFCYINLVFEQKKKNKYGFKEKENCFPNAIAHVAGELSWNRIPGK